MKNEYLFTWEISCSRVTKRLFNGIGLIARLLFLFSAVCLLCISYIYIWILSFFKGFMYLFIALVFIYFVFINDYVQAWFYFKNQPKTPDNKGWLVTFLFEDDKVVLYENDLIMSFPYNRIIKISDKKEEVFVFFSDRRYIRFYKSTFIDCTWEECKQLMLSKAEKLHK